MFLRGADPDRVAGDLGIAVRRAGVIDEPRDVAADGRVTHVEAIQLEAPDMPLLQVADFPLETFAIRDLLAVVGDDPLVLGNGLGGEDAGPFNLGAPFFDHL